MLELVNRREDAAIKMAHELGSSTIAVLESRVKDIYGASQDLVILELPLGPKGATKGGE